MTVQIYNLTKNPPKANQQCFWVKSQSQGQNSWDVLKKNLYVNR